MSCGTTPIEAVKHVHFDSQGTASQNTSCDSPAKVEEQRSPSSGEMQKLLLFYSINQI
jgi:hypothetical protein